MAHQDRSSYYDKDAPFDPHAQGHARTQSSGYNAASFALPARQASLKGGRDEEEPFTPEAGWDIYNDFNNFGPRLATAQGAAFTSRDVKGSDAKTEAGATPEVELITVLAFGAEWNKKELRGLTKYGKQAARSETMSGKVNT